MMNLIKIYSKFGLLAATLYLAACGDFIEIDPAKDQIATEKVYDNDETATSALRGIYAQMMSTPAFASGGNSSVGILAGRSADEYLNYNTTDAYIQFSLNNLLPDNYVLQTGLWQEPYKYIYFANAVLENLERSVKVSAAIKKQLQGEAKFIRAFCHFYLGNLFAAVPVVLTTDYRINRHAVAGTQQQLYEQVTKDLLEAKTQLSETYPSSERIRPNKWAAAALISRVYLYTRQWKLAEIQATEVIDQEGTYRLLPDIDQVFLKNSQEAILQFVTPVFFGINTYEGQIFILNASPTSSKHVGMSTGLMNAFEPGDQRRIKWVGAFSNTATAWYYPFKYKIRTGIATRNEYSMVLRLAEQYLIRAEARAMQGNFSGACIDLNKTRKRAGLNELSYDSAAETLVAIEQERRIELFSEWGHRWFDLKRTNRADAVLGPLKGVNWQKTDEYYPLPASELLNNQNLKQNNGYH